MQDRFIATQMIGHTGSEYWLWEYDLARPRQPNAEDPRSRFAVKGLVGIYPSPAKLGDALSRLT